MVFRLPYRHLLLEFENCDSQKIGDLFQLASQSDPKILQDDLNSHTAGGVNFFHISCKGFTQTGVSRLQAIDGVNVEKSVITDPDYDLTPTIRDAKVGRRFVCLIDAEFKDHIIGIQHFVNELNLHYRRTRGKDHTEVLVLFSDQRPPEPNDIDVTLPFEVDDQAEKQGLWNNPVWGYVRIHGNREPRVEPQHDDTDKSLVVVDFSHDPVERPSGLFGYQNYVIQNVESRFYTGLHHFLNQLECLEYSLVRSSSTMFSDTRTEEVMPTSILHSVAYDPLILYEKGVIQRMDSATIYCNLDKGDGLWGLKQAKPWNGAERRSSLWDFAAGTCENPLITRLCNAFVSFLRNPTEISFEFLLEEIENFTKSVLLDAHAQGYRKHHNLNQLLSNIEGIASVNQSNTAQWNNHHININLTKHLIELRTYVEKEILRTRHELDARVQNPSLVVCSLRAMFCIKLHDLIHKLFIASREPRIIKTYQLHRSA